MIEFMRYHLVYSRVPCSAEMRWPFRTTPADELVRTRTCTCRAGYISGGSLKSAGLACMFPLGIHGICFS